MCEHDPGVPDGISKNHYQIMAVGVSAIIVTHNRKDRLRRCLVSIQDQTHSVREIIVVDNASTDGTANMLERDFPEVTNLALSENTGAAGGFAAGMDYGAESGVEWLWVLNDDNHPTSGCLERLLEEAEALTTRGIQVGMVAPRRVRNGNINRTLWKGRTISESKQTDDVAVPSDIVVFNGCLISSQVVEEIGVPHGPYFMMMEEHEFSLRVRKSGFSNFVFPCDAFKYETADSYPSWRNYYQTRNHLDMVLRRHPSWQGLFWWFVRQLKFTYGILFISDRKLERFRMRLLGAYHGAIGKLGRTITPDG